MLLKCEECGKLFGAENGETKCSSCRLSRKSFKSSGNLEVDKFNITRELVYDNPDISPEGIVELMEDLGYDIKLREIMKYVADGRLNLASLTEGNHCNHCGTKIGRGKLCDRCQAKKDQEKVKQNLSRKIDEEKNQTSRGIKMHLKK